MKNRCPNCGRPIYNRRRPTCEHCGKPLPPAMLMTDAQRGAIGRIQQAEARRRKIERAEPRSDSTGPDLSGMTGP